METPPVFGGLLGNLWIRVTFCGEMRLETEGFQFWFALVLRLRPALIRAPRVLPSMPPLFHRVERHFLLGQFGGFSVSGIHLCPHTSQTATRILVQPMAAII